MEIYALTDPRDGAIRYIGKAKNAQKRLKSHLHNRHRRNSRFRHWLLELEAIGLQPTLSILVHCSEQDWASHEKAEIAKERANNPLLLNIASGGNAPAPPTDPLMRRIWEAKKRWAQTMPKCYGQFSGEFKARMRARIRQGYEHIFNEDGTIVPGARYDDGALINDAAN